MSNQRETDRHVVLIGLPGAGKTSIGRPLAKLLQRPFADADEQLALNAGCTIPQLVEAHGHDELRQQEQQTLANLLERYAPLVISAPGAIEIHPGNRELLARSAIVLWIRGSLPLLANLSNPGHRPRLADGHLESLRRLEAELSAHYQDIADHVVDIDPFHSGDDPTPDDEPKHTLARHIAALLTTGDNALAPVTPDTRTIADWEAALSPLYEQIADHTVDTDPFHHHDDPTQAITDHILALLALDVPPPPLP
jgi:shikimate kinase